MGLDKTKKRIWIIIGTVAIIAVAVFLVAGRRRPAGSGEYEFVAVERGDIENTISSTGTLNAVGTVEVGTQVSGIVDKVYVDFNDEVKKHQILAVLDTTLLAASVRDAQANLLKAQAQYDLTLTKYDNAQELFKNEFISELDFKTAKTDYEAAYAGLLSAQTALERTRTNLKYAVVRSPINGKVINRNVEPGQTVAASLSTPTLFVIAEDLSRMEIHAYVDESDIGQIKDGQSVLFTVEAYPDETFTGSVREIRLQPETIQNVVNYTVVVDATNEKVLLLPGMTATVDFVVEQRKDVLVISNAAIRFEPTSDMLNQLRKNRREKIATPPDSANKTGNNPTHDQALPGNAAILWYLDRDGKLNIMPVRTGATDGKNTEIVQGPGIKEGMLFISGVGRQNGSNTTSKNNQQGRPPGPPRFF